MKTVLSIILLIVVFIGAGYFGLPVLIKKETTGLRSDVQDLKQRLQKMEEESKAAPLKPDADVQKVIKTVNAVYHKLNSLEDSFNKDLSAANEAIKKQKATTEEVFKKHADTIDKLHRETQEQLQRIKFDAAMANIRGNILKVRDDLLNKNIGMAKAELDLIADAFEHVKTSATIENKKIIEDYQVILKNAKTEIDADLPSTINRIDLLWHEMSKLLRKA